MTSFARTFAGDAISPNGRAIVIYETSPSRSTIRAFKSVADGATLHFVRANNSLAQMSAIQNETTTDYLSLKNSGILLDEAYPDDATGKLVVGVVGVTAAQSATLESMFGAANIEVVNDPPNNYVLDANREDDSTPWNGGDNITDCPTSGSSTCNGDCTSGFGVTNGTYDYLITASHCYSYHEEIYNGFSLANGSGNLACDTADGSGCADMGLVSSTGGGYGGTDSEIIKTPGGSSDLVWTGVIGHAVRAAIYDQAGGSTINDYVCNEGAYTTEECGLKITDKGGSGNNLCKTVESFYFCHLVEAVATPGTTEHDIASGVGDSGGSVIWANNGTWYGVGTVTAHGGTLKSCAINTMYIVNHPTQACGTSFLYTSLSSTLSNFSVDLNS
jgi:hypothetical protein